MIAIVILSIIAIGCFIAGILVFRNNPEWFKKTEKKAIDISEMFKGDKK